jgi:hypothetical protein
MPWWLKSLILMIDGFLTSFAAAWVLLSLNLPESRWYRALYLGVVLGAPTLSVILLDIYVLNRLTRGRKNTD